MAFTPETVQSRARNLRTEAVKAASVMRGHVARVDATIAVLLSAVEDLRMYAANRKAERTEDEKALDSRLFTIADRAEAGEDVLDDILAFINEIDPQTEAEAPAPAETKTDKAPAETKPARKVKDAPQA